MPSGTEKIHITQKTGSEKKENNIVLESELDALISFMETGEEDRGYNEIRENPSWFIGDGCLRNGHSYINYMRRS